MKLKKVAALCSANRAFILFDENRKGGEIRQWLGDGYSIYLLSGLPLLDENNVCAMFDIPEKKRKRCRSKRQPVPDNLNLEDWEQGERALDDEWPTVEYDGRVVKPLSTIDGMTFIQDKYLAPLEDIADYLRLFERVDADGNKYIVAKNGMEIAAIIMPVDIINEGFVEKLDSLAYKCRQALEEKKEREYLKTVERMPGPLFRENAEAGEAVEEGAGE